MLKAYAIAGITTSMAVKVARKVELEVNNADGMWCLSKVYSTHAVTSVFEKDIVCKNARDVSLLCRAQANMARRENIMALMDDPEILTLLYSANVTHLGGCVTSLFKVGGTASRPLLQLLEQKSYALQTRQDGESVLGARRQCASNNFTVANKVDYCSSLRSSLSLSRCSRQYFDDLLPLRQAPAPLRGLAGSSP